MYFSSNQIVQNSNTKSYMDTYMDTKLLLGFPIFNLNIIQGVSSNWDSGGCCKLVLTLLRAQRASMLPKDWAQITFRSEMHLNDFLKNPFYSQRFIW